MSRWTHIVGSIHVDTYTKTKNIEEYVKEKLKKAPKITGSERNATVFVNAEEGYSTFCGIDEKYQERVIITIQGDLRDKNGEKTRKEIINFLKYIQKLDWETRIFVINIEDESSQDECYILKEEKDYE